MTYDGEDGPPAIPIQTIGNSASSSLDDDAAVVISRDGLNVLDTNNARAVQLVEVQRDNGDNDNVRAATTSGYGAPAQVVRTVPAATTAQVKSISEILK